MIMSSNLEEHIGELIHRATDNRVFAVHAFPLTDLRKGFLVVPTICMF